MTSAEQAQWAQFVSIGLLAVVFIYMTTTFKPFVMHICATGQIIYDAFGWQIVLFKGTLWLAHFGEAWRQQYGSTWAVGWKRQHVWFYTPKGDGKHGTHQSE